MTKRVCNERDRQSRSAMDMPKRLTVYQTYR